jgi:peptidoglycan hydrolase-like protein with peptidoglycan-binding domain
MLKAKGAAACILSLVLLTVPIGSKVSASTLLQKGMSGEQVVQLQRDLKKLGYFQEECTGYYGDVTEQAVKKLQGSNGYIQDGIAGSQTLSLIRSLLERNESYSRTLKEGLSGDDVSQLQEDLKALGYFSGNATGYFGEATENAVKAFQRAYNLYSDGVVGSKTAETIKRALTAQTYRNVVLKKGMSGAEVKALQENLKLIGYFSGTCTGYFGSYTEQAVKNLQYKYGKVSDGVVGAETYSLIQDVIAGKVTTVTGQSALAASYSSPSNNTFKIPWSQAQNIFKIGTVATVLDIDTGKTFQVKRTFGYNHADTETLTAQDTAIMKSVFGGSFSWERRAIILIVGDTYIAASMAGMPHAGRDDKPSAVKVYDRSGGYGYGDNLDAVKGNNMHGVFDVHFYMSKTHSTNRVDQQHQAMIDKADEYARKNY